MKRADITNVKTEIARLSKTIKVLETQQPDPKFGFCGSKETGAVKRASMDVTRALADLRRPWEPRR